MGRHHHHLATLLVFVVLTIFVVPLYAQDTSNQTIHTVQRGDTLYRIAVRYGVSMDAIAEANGITNRSRILAGQQLVIPNYDPSPTEVDNPLVAGTPIYHTVTGGDTLGSIANRYGMTISQLMRLNNIADPNVIYRGQQLAVWSTTDAEPNEASVSGAPNEPAATVAEPPAAAPSTTYTVQPGDHLALIARRFGVSWSELAQANNLSNPNQIYSGQTLIIPSGGDSADLGIIAPPAPQYDVPSPTISVGRQVVVDLSDQMLYAFEDGVLLRSVLVSTGLPATPTVLGDYNVYWILESQTMSGPGYYLPDVPYVMYFYQGYGLHGTYWHSNFGNPMSHGCVNLPTPEAEWLYRNFVQIGTPVHVKM
jgi:LysM repeat protein